MLGESGVIDTLKNKFPRHIGDDAAILPFTDQENYVISKDLLVEDIHFSREYYDAKDLAHKALHVNLSDIAAMGAVPKYVLLGISLPRKETAFTHQFLQKFSQACEASKVEIIGGDTTRSADKLFLSITIIGSALKTHLKFRHGAETDDVICVAGHLGSAHIGFTALEHRISGFTSFKNAFLRPNAFVKEGFWFGNQTGVTSMMDISDGLYIDLKRLCEVSNKAGQINLDHLQISEEFVLACEKMELQPIETQLAGGEDYSLLFTVKASEYSSIALAFEKQFSYPLKAIGNIKKGSGVSFIQNGLPKSLDLRPFSHFGESL